MITNILKNGTVVEDMSKVTVPKEVVQAVVQIAERKNDKKRKKA